MMAVNRGKLLVSTKSQAAGRKAFILVWSMILYALAIFLLLNMEVFAGKQLLGWFSVVFLLALPTFCLVMTVRSSKSYCEVYETAVVGVTCPQKAQLDAPMQSFELPYPQIMNVTESSKSLTLHTSHGSYEVLALKNRSEAVQEIRARMGAGRKGDAP